MQKTYELVVLLHPDIEIDVETPIAKIEGLVQAGDGKVLKRDNWGKKRLAYKIAHQDFAIYIYFELELHPEKVQELEATILITEEVLRHIMVVHEENPPRVEAKAAEKAEKKTEVTVEEGAKDDGKEL
jgi:small subunit ribosomal protein S6